jgi:hypothetical protein
VSPRRENSVTDQGVHELVDELVGFRPNLMVDKRKGQSLAEVGRLSGEGRGSVEPEGHFVDGFPEYEWESEKWSWFRRRVVHSVSTAVQSLVYCYTRSLQRYVLNPCRFFLPWS